MNLCASFDPVVRQDARVLILGSLPGAESLRRQEYYANRHNAFWKIMNALIGADADMPYRARLARLKEHHIALWDVCKSASRIGSLDSNIDPASVETNDFAGFFTSHKQIKLLCFNGQPAARLFERKAAATLPAIIAALPRAIFPSTSPAHAGMRFEQKLEKWREVIAPFLIPTGD